MLAALPPMVSARWFPQKERVTATAFGMVKRDFTYDNYQMGEITYSFCFVFVLKRFSVFPRFI